MNSEIILFGVLVAIFIAIIGIVAGSTIATFALQAVVSRDPGKNHH